MIDPEPTFDGTAQLLPLFFFLIKYQLPAFQPSGFHFGGLLSSNRVSVFCFSVSIVSALLAGSNPFLARYGGGLGSEVVVRVQLESCSCRNRTADEGCGNLDQR